MDRTRVKLIVEVDIDAVPGAFHTPEQARLAIQFMLNNSIPHYNPEVTIQQD